MAEFTSKERYLLEKSYGQINIFEQINKSKKKDGIKMELSKYSLDDFSGQEPPYEDMFVGFNTSKNSLDNDFVVTAEKADFVSIADFKLKTGSDIAFAQKESTECSNIAALYEKRVSISNLCENKKTNNKEAAKEAAEIRELESVENDDLLDDINEDTPKNKSKASKIKPK